MSERENAYVNPDSLMVKLQPFDEVMLEVFWTLPLGPDNVAPVAVGRKVVSHVIVSASDALDVSGVCGVAEVGNAKKPTSSAATVSFPEILNWLFIVSSAKLGFAWAELKRRCVCAELRGVLEGVRDALGAGLVCEVLQVDID
jgi:hypothetical protein